jgi:hypothetical protein
MDYKKRMFVLDIKRKIAAPRLGLTYAQFNQRLNGFVPFQPDEERMLCAILDEAEAAHAAIEQGRDNKEQPYYAK